MTNSLACFTDYIFQFFYFQDRDAATAYYRRSVNDRLIKNMRMHFMVNAVLLCALLFSTCNGFTQSNFRRNTVYGELGGNGVFLSLNYERQLGTRPGLGVHFGLGNADADENFAFTFPIGMNYLFNVSNQRWFIETGVGVTWALQNIWNEYNDHMPHLYKPGLIPSVSFRHETPFGLMWKIGINAVFSKNHIIPCYPGISLGWTF